MVPVFFYLMLSPNVDQPNPDNPEDQSYGEA